MNTRPVFVEKKMLKQHGIRRLFGAGALFFGLFLLVAVVSWVFREGGLPARRVRQRQ